MIYQFVDCEFIIIILFILNCLQLLQDLLKYKYEPNHLADGYGISSWMTKIQQIWTISSFKSTVKTKNIGFKCRKIIIKFLLCPEIAAYAEDAAISLYYVNDVAHQPEYQREGK